MTFRELQVGQTFDWINDEQPMMNSFFRRCIKTAARMYTTIDAPRMTMRVGSINAKVYHIEAD